jgi:hypothetical protein
MSPATRLRALVFPASPDCGLPADTCPEFDLLVACCAVEWNPAEKLRARRLFASTLDWEKLFSLAEHHGLAPLFFPYAAGLSPIIPGEMRDALRFRSQQAACRALWFTHELTRILDCMNSAGVCVIPHKGPALATLLYGDVAARQFNDLDLLVRPQDVDRARSVLVGLGYRSDSLLRPPEDRSLMRTGYEQVFHGSHGRNLLELQWRILPRFYSIDFDMEQLFVRAKATQFAGRQCRTLSCEDQLLTLCVHAAKHGWTQLSWLRDVAQLARTPGLAWHFIASEAKRLGIQRIVTLNGVLASRLFGGRRWPLPSVHAGHATNIIAEIVLASLRNALTRPTDTLEYFRWMMGLRERRSDQARLIWRLASTPHFNEWNAVKLPAPMFLLYPIVRAARLAKRLAAGAI